MQRQLFRNVFFLGLFQVTNYLVPLIVIPILLDRIGVEKYGITALAVGIMNVLAGVGDYGLNLTGTREISKDPSNLKIQVDQTRRILTLRIILILILFGGLSLSIAIVPLWRENAMVILSSYLIVVARLILPIWYFQGRQEMHWITLINFISRLMYIISILLFVHQEDDYVFVNLLNGTCWLLSAVGTLFIVFQHIGISNFRIDLQECWSDAKRNTSLFLANSTSTAYRNGAIVIAGFILSGEVLGVFAVIDRIIAIICSSASVVFRSLFPKASELANKGLNHLISRLIFLVRRTAIPVLLLSLSIGFFAPHLLPIIATQLSGIELQEPFLLVALIPPLLLLNVPLSLALISAGMDRSYLIYHLSGLITLILMGSSLGLLFNIAGLIWSLIIMESVMITFGFYFLFRAKTRQG